MCTAVVRHDHGEEDSACGKNRGVYRALCTSHWGVLPGSGYLLPNIKPTAKLAVSVLSVEDSPGAEHALTVFKEGEEGVQQTDTHYAFFTLGLVLEALLASVNSSNLWIQQLFLVPEHPYRRAHVGSEDMPDRMQRNKRPCTSELDFVPGPPLPHPLSFSL